MLNYLSLSVWPDPQVELMLIILHNLYTQFYYKLTLLSIDWIQVTELFAVYQLTWTFSGVK